MRRTWLTTNFFGGKKEMETRIHSIMDTTKKRTGVAAFVIVLLATIATGVTFVHSSSGTALDEQSVAVGGKPETGSEPMDPYSAFLTKVEHDPVKYYYRGSWVRSLYDENPQSGKRVLYFNAVEDADVPDKPAVDLKTVRNKETGAIERLEEMSGSEVFQLMNDDQVQSHAMVRQ